MTDERSRSALYAGHVWHRRFRPRQHKLAYRIPMLLVDLAELSSIDRRLRFFSYGRFNLMSFFDKDHLDGTQKPLAAQVRETLAAAGLEADGSVRLLCMPRVLGSVFNPLSVYFCERRDGGLEAILYEVNNTFGQRHSYLLKADDQGVIQQECEKRFYVSPFNTLEMRYAFRIVAPGDFADDRPASVRIDVSDTEGLILTAAFSGERRPLSDAAILSAWLRNPLLLVKVVGAIHWEALKLWAKGMKLTPRPPPPEQPVTTG